ncbi:DivIVA domain-containing protein [Actinoplanes sp. NPDC051494]|uniref:DivIVA domain-containing protein n=1 Tax=Actinoplanes sp. NPDC051494 TaxID=3363907 RepID=UPI00378BAF61
MGQLLLFVVVALVVAAIVFGVTVMVSGGDTGLTPVEPDGRALPLPSDRPLGEDDIFRTRFDTAFRGYRMAQVDQALQRAAYDVGYKGELIGVLEAEVAALREGRTADADVLRRAREAAVAPPAVVQPAELPPAELSPADLPPAEAAAAPAPATKTATDASASAAAAPVTAAAAPASDPDSSSTSGPSGLPVIPPAEDEPAEDKPVDDKFAEPVPGAPGTVPAEAPEKDATAKGDAAEGAGDSEPVERR